MNIEQVLQATMFQHKTLKNADGSPLRARVNGKVKTWKREPEKFCVPVKYGLRDYFYITNFSGWVGQGHAKYWQIQNNQDWVISNQKV